MTIRSSLSGLLPMPGLSPALDSARREEERWRSSQVFERREFRRAIFAPPDMPAPRAQAFRRVFDATMKDDAFLTEAKKLRLKVKPSTGEELNVLVNAIMNTSPPVAARVQGPLEVSTAHNKPVFHPAHL